MPSGCLCEYSAIADDRRALPVLGRLICRLHCSHNSMLHHSLHVPSQSSRMPRTSAIFESQASLYPDQLLVGWWRQASAKLNMMRLTSIQNVPHQADQMHGISWSPQVSSYLNILALSACLLMWLTLHDICRMRRQALRARIFKKDCTCYLQTI